MQIKLLSLLILSFISVAQADDFKTITGKEYKDATVTRIEPDGIVLTNKAGSPKFISPNFLRTFSSASAMILKEPPITQPSKVPDSTKSERSKQKPRGGKRKRPKRQINIEQNNKLDRMSFARCKAATRNCRGRKMNYFSVSVRRRNRDQRITEVRTTKLFATLRIRKHRSC